jgi:hypothetical protein
MSGGGSFRYDIRDSLKHREGYMRQGQCDPCEDSYRSRSDHTGDRKQVII